MLITRVSPFSGIETTQEIDVTEEQLDRWQNGELIQNVMPHLTPSEREFIMTGITEAEWENMFGEDSEEKEEQSYNEEAEEGETT